MTLAVFRDPASVAVVGASDHPAKWGNWLARGAISAVHRRAVYLVNATASIVLDRPSYRRLSDLPEVPELVVLTIPASTAGVVVDEALELGVRGLIVISAGGFEEDLGKRVQAASARMIGPNCLGLYDAAAELRLAWGSFTAGSLGIVSQSGQLGVEIANLAAAQGIGVSRFVSVGNQTDVTIRDVLEDLVDHEPTRMVALYAEDFGDGRVLVRTVARLREAGKPTVLLTVGGSDASREAARSHTGALTAPLDVVDAACRAAGAIRVRTPAEAAAVAQLLLRTNPAGDRLAILADSGGQGAIAADLAIAAGLRVPRLSDALSAQLAQWLPEGATTRNPVDLAGAGEQDLGVYSRVAGMLTSSEEVDTVLLTGYFGSYGVDTATLQGRELEVVAELGPATVVHSMSESCSTVDALRNQGIPVYRDVDSALTALGGGVRSPRAVPRAMSRVGRLTGTVGSGYLAARELLSAIGVRFPAYAEVNGVVQLESLRAPYVLKADWLSHKSEAGGVVLGLTDRNEVVAAHADLVARIGPGRYVVEEMDTRPHVVEMIVGARRDPSFGPVVMVGAGGIEVELRRDTTVELAPVDSQQALEMLHRLRCAPLLDGWRGRSAVDKRGLADLIAAVSELITARPDIAEVELNPVRVTVDGPLAVDALVVEVS
ncbi:acyl-CoA synthetase (NDP forming) [Kibdelosporangium banguiense]|uniref:Acyl-CoA synthetase (NDP forming) n=1 Tax=Kibdelosporangium banguiense TaxID=1365924 RepID=A0ABS4T6R4_9PSEU|nr:acetate--CoA ligase family protein [Kibdelosporangium banguiense]MBP2320100.1 acyl-CoA synthetase (NDP forming) [Kibdelosporangium banguiense]